jgi:hypothetical protein
MALGSVRCSVARGSLSALWLVGTLASCADDSRPAGHLDPAKSGAPTAGEQGGTSASQPHADGGEPEPQPAAGGSGHETPRPPATTSGGKAPDAEAGAPSDTAELPGLGGTTGNESEGGAAGESSSGAAGAPGPSAEAVACAACGEQACSDAFQGCAQNQECAPWLACVEACDSSSCSSRCDARFAGLSRVYQKVYACLCGACQASCQFTESCSKSCDESEQLPPTGSAPASLADTGLYTKDGKLSTAAYPFDVRFPLWADGAGKGRYVYVPPCSVIDTHDMDHWDFPVGTRFWKEFGVDGKLIETRLLHRFGSGADDWLYATYAWDQTRPTDASAALLVERGQSNAGGTLHDIPELSACPSCHGKLPDRALGFSAFQLSHAEPGLNMQKLSDWGWLSAPARAGFRVPGTAVQQAALGYLHGNCGGCHNQQVDIPREDPMRLRLLVGQRDYAATDAVLTTIGVATINAYPELHGKPRIAPRHPEDSAVYLRMSDRNKFPMPPLASKFSDLDGGDAAVEAWIDSL